MQVDHHDCFCRRVLLNGHGSNDVIFDFLQTLCIGTNEDWPRLKILGRVNSWKRHLLLGAERS
jgi:hypothetical protein